MKNIFFFLVLSSLILYSCSENEQISSDKITSIDFSDCMEVNLEPLNIDNPMEYVGITHNEALDHAAKQVDVTSASDGELFDAIKDYFYQNKGTPKFFQSLNNQLSPELLFDDDDIASGMSFEDYKLKYTYPGTETRDRILDELQEIVFETSHDDEQQVINDIIAYEAEFFQTESEATILHFSGMFSVLRHSIEYWTEARDNECHP